MGFHPLLLLVLGGTLHLLFTSGWVRMRDGQQRRSIPLGEHPGGFEPLALTACRSEDVEHQPAIARAARGSPALLA